MTTSDEQYFVDVEPSDNEVDESLTWVVEISPSYNTAGSTIGTFEGRKKAEEALKSLREQLENHFGEDSQGDIPRAYAYPIQKYTDVPTYRFISRILVTTELSEDGMSYHRTINSVTNEVWTQEGLEKLAMTDDSMALLLDNPSSAVHELEALPATIYAGQSTSGIEILMTFDQSNVPLTVTR